MSRFKTIQLSLKQLRILKFLAATEDWVTREEMKANTGAKGFSKALGAPTRLIKPGTLECMGLVERRDMSQPFAYKITESGRQALFDYEARREDHPV